MRPILSVFAGFLLTACHHTPTARLPADAPRVGLVVEDRGSSSVAEGAVPALRIAVAAELAEHGYATTEATRPPGAATLTLRTETEFFAQVAGRYRWTVRVRATIDRTSDRVEKTWDIPVFLVYDHEREVEAVQAAIPSIERHLDALLDEALPARSGRE